jgi:hypothetical protein
MLLACLFLSGCATINRDALASWTANDVVLIQDLQAYRVAQSKPVDDLAAHSAKAFGAITATEEQALMAELTADVANDAKLTPQRKASLPLRITAHMNLFTSLKGGN